MEFLTIFLSGLLTLLSPAGIVIDKTGENIMRSQFKKVEFLQLRVDNPPSYQILQGKVEKVLFAGRGLFPLKDFRIDILELETDAINVDVNSWRKNKPKLKQPLQAGVRLVLNQTDINTALHSPEIIDRLRNLSSQVLTPQESRKVKRLEFINPQIDLLTNNRLRLQITIKEIGYPEELNITAESGLQVISGRQIQVIEPVILINNKPAPPRLVSAIATGINNRLNLHQLESKGITARILQFQINPKQLEIASFIRVEPRFLENNRR